MNPNIDLPVTQPRAAAARAPRRRRALHIVLYAALVSALAVGVSAHRAAAELRERAVGLGRGLENFAGLEGRMTALSFNGASFSLSTKVVAEPVERVLERFVDRCSVDTELLASELGARSALSSSFFQRLLVMRDLLDDGTATAVCLGGLGEGGLSGLSTRVESFASSGDVSELGQLRYTYLRGSGQKTHVIMVSSDGPLQLGELFPSDRDVTGPEVVNGVRPADSTRILAAAATGTPHIMNVYRVKADPDAAISDYGGKLEAAGYKPAWIPSGYGSHYEVSQDTTYTRAYMLGTHAVITTSQPEKEGGSVLAVAQIERQLLPAAGDHDEHR
jgi:hypothetical protein